MRVRTTKPAGRCRPDEGQIVLLGALVIVFASLVSVGVAEVGSAMVARQRAHTAADAAALAGLAGGRAAAQELALRNGATLVQFDQSASEVTVVVRVGSARATARAGDGP